MASSDPLLSAVSSIWAKRYSYRCDREYTATGVIGNIMMCALICCICKSLYAYGMLKVGVVTMPVHGGVQVCCKLCIILCIHVAITVVLFRSITLIELASKCFHASFMKSARLLQEPGMPKTHKPSFSSVCATFCMHKITALQNCTIITMYFGRQYYTGRNGQDFRKGLGSFMHASMC